MKILNNLRLGQKMFIGFGVIILLLISVLLFGYFGMKNNSALFVEYNVVSQKVDLAGRIQANFSDCRVSFLKMILLKDLSQESVFKERYKKTIDFIRAYKEIENDSNNIYIINTMEQFIITYNSEFNNALTVKNEIKAGNDNIILSNSLKKIDEIGPKIADDIESLKLKFLNDKSNIENRFKYNSDAIAIMMLALSIFGTILAIIISISITRFVLNPVLTLTKTFKKISEGHTDMNVRINADTNDEIGEMSRYFNMLMHRLEGVFYSIKTDSIIKTRQNEIDSITRGEQNLHQISSRVINYVSKLTDAYLGAIYVKDENDKFSFVGSYAIDYEEIPFLNDVHSKKGVFGQSVIDKTIRVISDIPDDYFKVNSGLGKAKPKNIIIIPCALKDEVICVIEIGSFKEFTKEEIEILDSISEVIAIGINATISREKINDLYQKTLQQTEELQVQQEELMQSHEELTEQTNSLIEKESQLQVQQEELQVTNSELEERNREITYKNSILESTKDELLSKANALELSGKYKSEFLANVSHELRTPLNSILVLSQLLIEKNENSHLTNKQLEYANTIHNSGSELLTLINDILDLAKVEAGKIQIDNDNISLSNLENYFKSTFDELATSKSLDFNIIISSDMPKTINTDELRLKQILKNLLSNAFKFTDEGTVELKISLANEGDNSKVCFTVTDTGIGIEKDKTDIIFEAFKQADGTINRKFGGTGLGLSISKELSRLLGGSIFVESEYGVGSTFVLTVINNNENQNDLVIDDKDTNMQMEKVEEVNEVKTVSDKVNSILIIEDDEIFAKVLCDFALEKNLSVLMAADGNSGIQMAKENLPDAIILDIGLPDMSGVEVLKQLENDKATQNIPIHIISGHDKNESFAKKTVLGYLKKPVTINQIEKVFNDLNDLELETFKNILIVGIDDIEVENSLKQNKGIIYKSVSNAKEANELLENQKFDCIILDKELEDMATTSFLGMLHDKEKLNIPILIYTDKEITIKEEEELSKYSDSIIIRGAKSLDRLVAETDIFLYKLNENAFKRKISGKTNKLIEEDKLSGKKVLLVDDDVRNIFSLTGVLESKGIQVIVGRNGKEGIEKFVTNTDIDLILMDIMMPVIDGYETIRVIRKMNLGKNVPIIAITAKSMPEDRIKCIEAGADDYTTKPVDVEKLISQLRVWLFK